MLPRLRYEEFISKQISMCVYLHTKIQVSSMILTSLRWSGRGGILPRTAKQTPKKPTQSKVNQVLLFPDYRHPFRKMSYLWLAFNPSHMYHFCIIRKNISPNPHTLACLVEKQTRNQKLKFSIKSVFGKREQIYNYL